MSPPWRLSLLAAVLAAGPSWCQRTAGPAFYGTSAGGKTSAARGWNSFVAQSNGHALTVGLMDQHCSFFYGQELPAGVDYVCSFDSGWSIGGNGDQFGRIAPEPSVFQDMSIQQFARRLHARGMKLGVYALPGAFTADADKTVENTTVTIGSLFNSTVDGRPGIGNDYNARCDFDYRLPGVQEWHDSVVSQFASWGVDFIKLDYVTPGSDLDGSANDVKPANSSGAVAAYHSAITRLAPSMRLGLSWRLDRTDPWWSLWRANADALRLDRDINYGRNPVQWDTVQRAAEQYRQYMHQQVSDPSRRGQPIRIRPDMDSLLVSAPASASSWSGLNTVERYGQAILWVGAGANLIAGSDLTQVDVLGRRLLTHPEVLDAAAFAAEYPMVPRLPGDRPTQLQAWIAGPNRAGDTALVVLTNFGPDLCHDGCTFDTQLPGPQQVRVTFAQLGIDGASWFVRRVLGNGDNNNGDFTDLGPQSDFLAKNLSEHENVMYKLTRCGADSVRC